MGEDYTRDHVHGIVGPQDHHRECLSKHGEYGKVGHNIPANSIELQRMHNAAPYVARVKEVGGGSITDEDAHVAREAPIITWWFFNVPQTLY